MGVGVVQSRVGSAALRYGGRAQRPQQRVRRRHFAARRAVLCGRWLGGWWPRERATPVAAALAAATVAAPVSAATVAAPAVATAGPTPAVAAAALASAIATATVSSAAVASAHAAAAISTAAVAASIPSAVATSVAAAGALLPGVRANLRSARLGFRSHVRRVRRVIPQYGWVLPQCHVGSGRGPLPAVRCSAVRAGRAGSDEAQRLRPRRGIRMGVGVMRSLSSSRAPHNCGRAQRPR